MSLRPWTYHPDLLAVPVPRYTSFPTAAEFGDGMGTAGLDAALGDVTADEPVSLYAHVPYCREICWYCGCNTGAANRAGRLDAYVQRLGQEIEAVAARLGGRGRVQRIAWGGGSPNALSVDAFRRLSARMHSAFGAISPVTSIELDPRAFDAGWAELLAELGGARVSLGVQTFAPHIQAAIGRVQPQAMVEETVAALRTARAESINFDLMYGLPHQSEADLADSIERSIALRPERIAVFGYAHVPDLLPRQRVIDATALPCVEARFRQAELAHDLLIAAGYVAIGFDHFALPEDAIAVAAREGRLRRNFQGFTEDPADVLLGLGASAIGVFPGALLQNEKNAGRYQMRVAAGGTAVARGLVRSADDRLRGALIERLLCNGGADLAPLPELASIRERLAPHAERGLIAWEGDRLAIMPEAAPYARSIAATLDPYRQPSARRFSSAV
jgi:oxygen-independent coproporphyrinogen-3 oxidase